jgi:hypothetical protein
VLKLPSVSLSRANSGGFDSRSPAELEALAAKAASDGDKWQAECDKLSKKLEVCLLFFVFVRVIMTL